MSCFFFFVIWASSGVLALLALAFAFGPWSRLFAIVSIIGSLPVSVYVAGSFLANEGFVAASVWFWLFLLITFAPLIVGTGVLCFDLNLSRKDGENGKQNGL